jgi:hypothetical protein
MKGYYIGKLVGFVIRILKNFTIVIMKKICEIQNETCFDEFVCKSCHKFW